jgi:uncharacterized protein YbaR (Trm112 family)
VGEAYRILEPGGYFYFNEEPFQRLLYVGLFSANRRFSKETLEKDGVLRAVSHFFAKGHCNEVEHGIVENDQITLGSWRDAFSLFKDKAVELEAYGSRLGRVDLFKPQNPMSYAFARILGGTLSGVCRKAGALHDEGLPLQERLRCPSCLLCDEEAVLDPVAQGFRCARCGMAYPLVDGILILLPERLFRELYPMHI